MSVQGVDNHQQKKDDIKTTLQQLQQIQLEILLEVDAFCNQHNIPYFLGEGTLLGAIRHKGFIPWDDDVDLLMKRADYDRFLALAQTHFSSRYVVQHPTTVKNYWSPLMKIRLLAEHEDFRQKHIAHLTDHNGPYIDIFPMEYLPQQTSIKQRWQFTKICILRGMLSLKLGLFAPTTLVKWLLRQTARMCSVPFLHRRLDRTFRQFGSTQRTFIGTLSSYHPYRCLTVPATTYDYPVFTPFEGHLLPVPSGYDLLLRTIYGDYMTPPPPEQRVAKHHFGTQK